MRKGEIQNYFSIYSKHKCSKFEIRGHDSNSITMATQLNHQPTCGNPNWFLSPLTQLRSPQNKSNQLGEGSTSLTGTGAPRKHNTFPFKRQSLLKSVEGPEQTHTCLVLAGLRVTAGQRPGVTLPAFTWFFSAGAACPFAKLLLPC